MAHYQSYITCRRRYFLSVCRQHLFFFFLIRNFRHYSSWCLVTYTRDKVVRQLTSYYQSFKLRRGKWAFTDFSSAKYKFEIIDFLLYKTFLLTPTSGISRFVAFRLAALGGTRTTEAGEDLYIYVNVHTIYIELKGYSYIPGKRSLPTDVGGN